MSIMKKFFSFGNNRKSRKPHSSTSRFQPQLEPLEDRHLLSVSSLLGSAISGTLQKTDNYTELDMHVGTQTDNDAVVGIRIDATSADFDPAAISIYNSKGDLVSGNAIKYSDGNFQGSSSSLLVVKLSPGDYKIRVAGEKGTYGSFTCDVFLPGDLNHDSEVDYGEYSLTNAAFLASSGKLNYVTISALAKYGYSVNDVKAHGELDINQDGKIAIFELESAAANNAAGKVTVSLVSDNEAPEVTSQLAKDDGVSSSDKITSKPSVTGTITDESEIASLKASFNGTDWVDVTIDSNGKFTISEDLMKTMTASPVATDGSVVNGEYSLKLKAADVHANEKTYTFNYTVIANNTPPTAEGKDFVIAEKGKLQGESLKGLVSDADAGDIVTIKAETVTSKEGISVTIKADGTFAYNPGNHFAYLNVGDTMVDEFEYTVTDAMGATTKGKIKITITPENDAPVAVDITESTDQNTNKTIDVIDKASDVDNDKSTLVIDSVTEPKNTSGKVMGEVKIENNELVFSPGSDFKYLPKNESVVVTFSYTIKDSGGKTSTKKVTMTVHGEYDAPVAKDDKANFNADDAGKEIDVLANDKAVDQGSDVLLVEIVSGPAKGTATIVDGKVVYNPNGQFGSLKAGETEDVTFTYRVKNSLDDSKTSTATVTVTITGVNTPPDTSGTTDVTLAEVKEDAVNAEIDLNELLKHITDVNDDTLTITEITSSKSGVSVKIENGKIVYNPGTAFQYLSKDAIANDTLTYTVSDGTSTSTGTVKIKIIGVNSPHTVSDQIVTVTSSGTNDPVPSSPITVTDLDKNDKYKFEILTKPSGAGVPEITIDKNTGVVYLGRDNLPAATADGDEYVITVKVTNAKDSTDTVTATIKIKVIENQPPTTVDVAYTIDEDADLTTFPDNIAGITDPEGDAFEFLPDVTLKSFEIGGKAQTLPTGYVITVVEDPANPGQAIVSFNPNGAFAAVPAGKTGIAVFEYQVRDKVNGGISTGKITITINGKDSAPVRNTSPLESTTDQDTSKTVDMNDFFTDPDNANVKVVGTPTVTGGSVTVNTDGRIVFNPGNDFKDLPKYDASKPATYRDVTVSFKVKGSNETYTLKIRVTGLNDAPAISGGTTAETNKNTATDAIDVLAKATDPDTGETASLVIGTINGQAVTPGQTVTLENGDSVTISADGKSLTYNPGTRFSDLGKNDPAGKAEFSYQVKDVNGALSNVATVTVTVNGADDPPEIKGQIPDFAKPMGHVETIDLNQYFSGQGLTFTVDYNDPTGMLDISINGNIMTIRFTDSYNSAHNREYVTITVTASNSAKPAPDGISQEFFARTDPQQTAEVELIAVKKSESNDFGYTVEEDQMVEKPTGSNSFAVGEEYYIEIWGTDLINNIEQFGKGYSAGLTAIIVSLGFDGTLVDFLRVETNPNATRSSHSTSGLNTENAMITKAGGGFNERGYGVDGNSVRVARILVRAKATGTVSFEIQPDSETDPEILFVSRNAIASNPDDKTVLDDTQIITSHLSVTHTNTPLLGEETPEAIIDGGVYSRVVTSPTKVAANGTVNDIPDNADWIHEWQEHWVELWVKASDVTDFISGNCTLNFDSRYFTATEVELSPAFAGNSNPVINNKTGQVTGIGGDATRLIKSDGYILLGRVKFESLGDNNVPFEEASYAHDLGISIENAKVVSSKLQSFSVAGKAPSTELWAVPYDVNDDGKVTFTDFAFFVNDFQLSESSDSYFISSFDFDRNGKVSWSDFAVFVTNFGDNYGRGSGAPVSFPESFTQRYVGKTLDTDSTATVNKIIDAANKAWQSALGLDRPVDIQIVVQDLSGIGDGNELANARITAIDANGLPLKGIIVLDDDAAGMGWYSQIAEPVANGRYDLYTTLLHEMGHIYGFNTSYDAFNEVVGQYVGQLDASMLHAVDSNDLMYATLATGVRKFISEFDVAIINSAYGAARNDGSLGFNDSVASSYAALTAETSQNAAAFVEQENGSFVAMLAQPTVAPVATQTISAETANQLHAMGLAVAMPLSVQQKEENQIAFHAEQIFSEDGSYIELADDDWASLHQLQEIDEKDQAWLDLELDLNA